MYMYFIKKNIGPVLLNHIIYINVYLNTYALHEYNINILIIQLNFESVHNCR